MRRYVNINFSLLFGVVYIHRRVAMYLCFFSPLLGVILWPRATTVRRRKSKNPRRTRRKSKPVASRPALPISLKTSPISQARYNGPFLFLRVYAVPKGYQHRQNNFPIRAARSCGTVGRAGGFVGDGKSGFGKLFGIRSLPCAPPCTRRFYHDFCI